MLRRRYHLVQGHEEAGLIGVFLGWVRGIPHLYDMHSSLPEQLENYQFSSAAGVDALMLRFLRWVEGVMLRGSDGVIVVCPYLVDLVSERAPRTPVRLIENRPPDDLVEIGGEGAGTRGLLDRLAGEGARIVLYTGTFEVNQGLDLLVDGFGEVVAGEARARLVLVGGEPHQVEAIRTQAREAGLGDAVHCTGQVPLEDIPALMDAAEVLVSARSLGKNSPLKLYSYLKWGKPIVATDRYTHTQVLSHETSKLVEPTARGLAAGILAVLEDPAAGAELGRSARARYEDRYTWERFVGQTDEVVRVSLTGAVPAGAEKRGPEEPDTLIAERSVA